MAMSEIVADMREWLRALAVGVGPQVMAQLMDTDVTAVCGPRGEHDPNRAADPARQLNPHHAAVRDPHSHITAIGTPKSCPTRCAWPV